MDVLEDLNEEVCQRRMRLILGDAIEEMSKLKENSVDLCLTDPPYGTTQCRWDSVVPLGLMWERLKRLTKPTAAICLFGTEPFSSHLRLSNLQMFKHDWIWKKTNPKGHLNAKKYPMKIYEIVSVFCEKTPTYHPQFQLTKPMNSVYRSGGNGPDSTYGKMETVQAGRKNRRERYPQDVVFFNDLPGNAKARVHPTQKSVSLLEYLIKTYTVEGDTVLDFTMGSGSTGVACKNLGRKFIGIEKDPKYFEVALKRNLEDQGK